MDTKLRNFFQQNDVRIGEGETKDFTTTPAMYYGSLDEGFKNYFLTFRNIKDQVHFVFHKEVMTREFLSYNMTGGNKNIILSILGFHRFFELLLKDILRRINPVLAVKYIEKEKDLFAFVDGSLDLENVSTIEYGETIKRFKKAFSHYKPTSDVYIQHLQNYEFLISSENLETLEVLTWWRNRIMHNGTTLPNTLAYDYLVSQRLVPLVKQIIDIEIKLKFVIKEPYYFKTKTGIHIIDEILKVKFNVGDFGETVSKDTLMSWIKLGHLKEVGRTAVNHTFYERINKDYYQPYYEKPTNRNEQFAEIEKKHEDFYNLHECFCCGAKTLVVYRKELDNSIMPGAFPSFISWVKCYNCDYSLKNNAGDPSFFKLSKVTYFAQN